MVPECCTSHLSELAHTLDENGEQYDGTRSKGLTTSFHMVAMDQSPSPGLCLHYLSLSPQIAYEVGIVTAVVYMGELWYREAK